MSRIYMSRFNPRPPRRGRPSRGIHSVSTSSFQSAPPAKGATATLFLDFFLSTVSIRAPREGGDSGPRAGESSPGSFNPRPPRRGRPHQRWVVRMMGAVSIRAPREGGDSPSQRGRHGPLVSIRAPREGGDQLAEVADGPASCFNPRPPRRGRRVWEIIPAFLEVSIRAPREGGDLREQFEALSSEVSIRAPREGGDQMRDAETVVADVSIRAPREGGDKCETEGCVSWMVSIRAPREGGDLDAYVTVHCICRFNPRPPRRGRLGRCVFCGAFPKFQSAPPAKGATVAASCSAVEEAVSIRAPREGGDFPRHGIRV